MLNLLGNVTADQMNDFLDEINVMKAVGSHKNIVSLIGCCINSSPNFLVVEFASQGDLLSYLREQRKKVKAESRNLIRSSGKTLLGILPGGTPLNLG